MSTVSSGHRVGRLDATDARHYWEAKAVTYDCLHDRLRQMLRMIAQRRPASILDLGCSTGEVARAVTAMLPGVEYFGCDISHAAVARLGRPNVVQCDFNADGVPFRGRKFDCVVASGICEYVVNQGEFLTAVAERLAPRGELLVSYVNIDHIARRWRRWLGKRPRDNATWQPLVPLQQFETLLSAAGLQVSRRLVTHGRITPSSELAERVSPLRLASRLLPGLISLLAPQVIFVCQKTSSL